MEFDGRTNQLMARTKNKVGIAMKNDFFNGQKSKRMKLTQELLDNGIIDIWLEKQPRVLMILYAFEGHLQKTVKIPVLEFPYPTVDQLDNLVDGTMDIASLTKLKGYLILNLGPHWSQIYTPKSTNRESGSTNIQIAFDTVKKHAQKLFIDEYGKAHIAITIDDHLEVLPIDGSRFEDWYRMFMYEKDGIILDTETINKLCSLARAYAASSKYGVQINLSLRTASRINSANNNELEWMYDLTNKNWEFIRIGSNGWYISKDEIIFRRYSNQQPQAYPAREYEKDIFDRFMRLVNLKINDEKTKLLVKCYIVCLFIPDIQKPVLMLHGPGGSAKTSLQEIIKMLVDPSIITTLNFPKDANDFIQQLSHNYVAYYDNISIIKEWISDLLCRAVSGSASSKRQLYTDDDDIIYRFKRCVGFNGINLGATKADLLDRGLIIKLEEIEDELRRIPEEVLKELEQIKPQLLGYIFDILVKVLNWKNSGSRLHLKKLPRMAEFAEYGEIISRLMGNPDNAFIDAYYENIGLQAQEVLESSPVAHIVQYLTSSTNEWKGTPTELLSKIEELAPELKINTKSKSWPKSPSSLSRKLNELKTSFKQIGIEIEASQVDKKRVIIIRKMPSTPSKPPETKNQAQKESQIGDGIGDDVDINVNMPSENEGQFYAQKDTGDDADDTDGILHASIGDAFPQDVSRVSHLSQWNCYYCPEGFDFQSDYEKHVLSKHPKKLCYPNKAYIEKHGLTPQGKHWEGD